MTWLVIAIALALPSAMLLVIDNLQSLGERWDGNPRITVFLKSDYHAQRITELEQRFLEIEGVGALEYISPDQALVEFQQHSGFGNVLELLDENPLPAVFIVTPESAFADFDELKSVAEVFARESEVDNVQLDLEWVQKMQQIIAFARTFAILLGSLLALGILLTIGNTIRLAIENRREEIVVVKLVGGTDAFVRRPLLYTGLWYGLVGGVFAWFLVMFGSVMLESPVRELAALYSSDFTIRGMGLIGLIQLTAVGSLLGLLGAWLAVARHLHLIQPR
jgi:cell division transport system permease protein